MLDVVEWMRAHNRGVPPQRQVRFAGIDPQLCGDSVGAVASFLARVAPERVAHFGALGVLAYARPGTRPDPNRLLLRLARSLTGFPEDHRAEFAARTTAEEADGAVEHARMIGRAADVVTRAADPGSPQEGVLAVRDRYMAEAVARLVDADEGEDGSERARGGAGGGAGGAGVRVAVWAHNGHIAKDVYDGGVPALGSRLRERYGDGYHALGLLFGKGSFRARRGATVQGPGVPHRMGSGRRFVESRFAAAVPGDFSVDLRAADPSSGAARWLREPHTRRSSGAAVPRWTYRFHAAPLVPAQDDDGLAFVSHSTCSRPLPQ
ncbi:erythromycin esterase family protein [Streptomyces sp. NPDC007369]|uniref:erythromycin esterase family protein n=1 Tax=Streptomyces sp. NPDC007369 TaxID=3154589 RepID=UPI0033D5FB12